MSKHYDRRQVLKGAAAAGASLLLPARGWSRLAGSGLRPQLQELPASAAEVTQAGPHEVEIQVVSISAHTVRLTVLPIKEGRVAAVPSNGSMARTSWGEPILKVRGETRGRSVKSGSLHVTVSTTPLAFTITIQTESGDLVQHLVVDRETGALTFNTGNSPLLGLGEGGPQFDRRGSADAMRSGQGGYRLATHGGRVPIPWIISTSGWAILFHQPFGTFDFTSSKSRFLPENREGALPLDLFVVASSDPATILAEYARLTGLAEMPPLWSFGYQQSHRTLASREEVIAEAKLFREKKLPCDAMIYLGTGFCPSGWNTENGAFDWNPRVFPEPKEILDELHEEHFRAVVHVVILSDTLRGTVHDKCELLRFDESEASCYWDAHRKDFAMGVDGWWPDEGDPLDM